MGEWWNWIIGLLSGEGSVAKRGEDEAAKFLTSAGYIIVTRNHRNKHGEIDIVALSSDGRTVIIVEVKAAAVRPDAKRKFRPEDHVNRAKQRKLARLASFYVKNHGHREKKIRFDVVGVDFQEGKSPVVRHHVAAFESYF